MSRFVHLIVTNECRLKGDDIGARLSKLRTLEI